MDWNESITEFALEEWTLSLALVRDAIGLLVDDSILWDLDQVLDATDTDFGILKILVDMSTLGADERFIWIGFDMDCLTRV